MVASNVDRREAGGPGGARALVSRDLGPGWVGPQLLCTETRDSALRVCLSSNVGPIS